MSLDKTLEQIQQTFEEFKTANNELLAGKAEGKAVGDLTAKVERINEGLDALLKRQDAYEAANKRPSAPVEVERDERKALDAFNLELRARAVQLGRPAPSPLELDQFRIYKKAFVKFIRGVVPAGMDPDEAKALTVGTEGDGGVLAPADMSGGIVRRVFDMSPVRQYARVRTISGPSLEGIEQADQFAGGWVGEQTTRSQTDFANLGRWSIPVQEMYAMPAVSQTLLDDAAVDVEAWVADEVAKILAQLEGAAFVAGNGVSKPRGFTTYTATATADASRAWGTMEYVFTGASGAFASSNPADCMIDLQATLKPIYQGNASWFMRRSSMALVRKFKDSQGNYLWQPSLAAGQPATFLSAPIVNFEDMPAVAANSYSIAYGDLSKAYTIVDRLGIRILRDPYTAKPNVLFYTIARTGGAVVDYDAVKLLKFGTS